MSIESPAAASDQQDPSVKERIIQSAGEIFAERGFKETTIRDIAKAADVNLAGVNYHFGGKQPLYRETVLAARQFRMQRPPAIDSSSGMEPAARLSQFIESLLHRLSVNERQDWRTRLLAREMMFPTDFCTDLIETWYRPIFEGLLKIIDMVAGRPLGEPQRTQIGFSIIGQCLFYRVSEHTVQAFVDPESSADYKIPQLAQHITEFSLGAIRHLAGAPPTA